MLDAQELAAVVAYLGVAFARFAPASRAELDLPGSRSRIPRIGNHEAHAVRSNAYEQPAERVEAHWHASCRETIDKEIERSCR